MVVPWFFWLSSSTSLPIRRSRLRLMLRPRPVPPNLRVTDESPWLNSVKMFLAYSGSMPMPVSITRNVTSPAVPPAQPAASKSQAITTRPVSVNLMALPAKFSSTCRMR